MRKWFRDRDYAGIDPYLLDEKAFSARQLPVIGPLVGRVRRILKPFHSWIPEGVFSRLSPVVIPKALGLIMSGNAFLYRLDPKPDYLEENRHLLNLLLEHRSPGFEHLCWGQPFAWGSSPRYPPHTPAVPATSPIAHGILDYYQVSDDEKALAMLDDVARYLILENGYEVFDDSLCLHYAPRNEDLVFNINAQAASFLLRLSVLTGDRGQRSFGNRAVKFVVEGQNPDGSWYYTDVRNGSSPRIDNRHTGFVLEHLRLAADILEWPQVTQAVEHGWAYYEEALFEGVRPKWSPTQVYPVDIHDVAQGIITSAQLDRLAFATDVVEFAFDKLFDGSAQFYYKLFQGGKVNQTVFIRWGQAWMFKALSLFALQVDRATK
jgi:hypothetical protein